MVTKIQNTYRNRILFPVLGFGLAGAIWGLEAYRGTVGAGESFTNPFSYVLGAVALAVFGGLALAYITQTDGSPFWSARFLFSKHTLKIVGIGLIGWLVAFFLPAVWVYRLWLLGGTIAIVPELFISGSTVDKFLAIEPSLGVGYLWIEFLLSGAIIGLVYSLLLKTKILRTALWGAGGFALASLVGPIIGNLLGNLFGSLLISYLVTFLVIGKIFGFALGRLLR